MTTYTSGQIDSKQLLVQAFLNISQDVSQGSIVQQNIKVDCNDKEYCNQCLETARKYQLSDNGDYSSICRSCYCNLENIKVNNIITLNLSAFQQSSGSDFGTQVQNALTQAMAQSGISSNKKDINTNSTSLQTTAASIYTKMKNTNFQEAVDQLKSFQIINVKNSNTSLINIDIDIVINYLSKIIQQTKNLSEDLTTMDTQINSIVYNGNQNILYIVISWIVTLVIILISVFMLSFIVSFTMQDMSLYVST
jgi:hypothetical protein